MLNFALQYKRQKLGRILFSLLVVTLAGLWGCAKGPDFARPFGHTASEERRLPSFTGLEIGERFRLFITSDTGLPESVTIHYGSNLLEGIETSVENGMLTIRDANNFNWVRSYKHAPTCTLNVHRLEKITLNGSAAVVCLDTLRADKIELNINSVEDQEFRVWCGQLYGGSSNSGRIRFSGQGTIFAWTSEDGSGLDAAELRCDDAYIFHYTDRDITVNPKNMLEAHAYGNGNIYYLREPALALKRFEFGRGKVLLK